MSRLITEKDLTRESAQNEIGGNQIDEDAPALLQSTGMALCVCCCEDNDSSMKMIVGKVESPEVVEVSDPLRGRVVLKRWAIPVNGEQHELSIPQLARLRVYFHAAIGNQVDPGRNIVR